MTGTVSTTRLGQPHRTARGSHVLVASAMLAFFGIALLKPWAAGDASAGPAVEPLTAPPGATVTPRVTTTPDAFAGLLERAGPYAGRAVVVGRGIPRYGTPVMSVLNRPTAQAKSSRAGWCAGGVRFDSPQRAVAFGYSHRVAPVIAVSVIARNGTRAPVKLAVAADAAEGLALVAPAGGLGWLPGRYDVTLRHAERGARFRAVERFLLCFRTPPWTAP